jgi:hypothetical protein
MWIPINVQPVPKGEDVDLLLKDGSEIRNCYIVESGHFWWQSGELYITVDLVMSWRMHIQD